MTCLRSSPNLTILSHTSPVPVRTNSFSSYIYQGLPSCLFPSGLSNTCTILHKFIFCPIHVTCFFPSHASLRDYWTNIWWQNISWSSSLCSLLQSSCTSCLLLITPF